MSTAEKASGGSAKSDGIPRFRMPMILMQSVLVPDYINAPDQVTPVPPCPSRRVCPAQPSRDAVPSRNDAKTCRLPFRDGDALAGRASSGGRRASARTRPGTKARGAAAHGEGGRTGDARKRLDRNLHAEHRVFMENLKLEREDAFRTRTTAAVVIQRYMRGLAVRINRSPEKYAALRASLETHYTEEELTDLVDAAIRRAGVTGVF